MSIVTTYLEMHSPDQLRPKRCTDRRFNIQEKIERDWRFNRDLYLAVGQMWSWNDKRVWSDEHGRSTGLHRSCGPSQRIMSIRSQAITNCVTMMEAVLRSPTLVCYRSLLVVDWEEHY